MIRVLVSPDGIADVAELECRDAKGDIRQKFWVAQRFTAAIQAIKLNGVSH
jgi:hypothetical protein